MPDFSVKVGVVNNSSDANYRYAFVFAAEYKSTTTKMERCITHVAPECVWIWMLLILKLKSLKLLQVVGYNDVLKNTLEVVF
jgi:hypothetical protein